MGDYTIHVTYVDKHGNKKTVLTKASRYNKVQSEIASKGGAVGEVRRTGSKGKVIAGQPKAGSTGMARGYEYEDVGAVTVARPIDSTPKAPTPPVDPDDTLVSRYQTSERGGIIPLVKEEKTYSQSQWYNIRSQSLAQSQQYYQQTQLYVKELERQNAPFSVINQAREQNIAARKYMESQETLWFQAKDLPPSAKVVKKKDEFSIIRNPYAEEKTLWNKPKSQGGYSLPQKIGKAFWTGVTQAPNLVFGGFLDTKKFHKEMVLYETQTWEHAKEYHKGQFYTVTGTAYGKPSLVKKGLGMQKEFTKDYLTNPMMTEVYITVATIGVAKGAGVILRKSAQIAPQAIQKGSKISPMFKRFIGSKTGQRLLKSEVTTNAYKYYGKGYRWVKQPASFGGRTVLRESIKQGDDVANVVYRKTWTSNINKRVLVSPKQYKQINMDLARRIGVESGVSPTRIDRSTNIVTRNLYRSETKLQGSLSRRLVTKTQSVNITHDLSNKIPFTTRNIDDISQVWVKSNKTIPQRILSGTRSTKMDFFTGPSLDTPMIAQAQMSKTATIKWTAKEKMLHPMRTFMTSKTATQTLTLPQTVTTNITKTVGVKGLSRASTMPIIPELTIGEIGVPHAISYGFIKTTVTKTKPRTDTRLTFRSETKTLSSPIVIQSPVVLQLQGTITTPKPLQIQTPIFDQVKQQDYVTAPFTSYKQQIISEPVPEPSNTYGTVIIPPFRLPDMGLYGRGTTSPKTFNPLKGGYKKRKFNIGDLL